MFATMSILYLLFFGALNFLIFLFFARKVEITKKAKIILIIYLLFFLVIHFFQKSQSYLSNQHFFHLIKFSAIGVVLHYGSMISSIMMKKVNKDFENHLSSKMYDFLRFYLIYILIFIYQSVSILLPKAHEYF